MNDWLLEILRCPACGADGFTMEKGGAALACRACGHRVPLTGGAADFLAGETPDDPRTAAELADWERNAPFYLGEEKSPLFRLIHRRKMRAYAPAFEALGLRVTGEALEKPRPGEASGAVRALDLGGGTGFFSRVLVDGGVRCATHDFSHEMLALAREHHDLTDLVRAGASPLPFADEAFDLVLANGVLHHLKAQGLLAEAAREARRVLKPGGALLVFDRNGALPGRLLHHFVLRVKGALARLAGPTASSASGSEPDFTPEDLEVVLDAGFEVERVEYVSTLPYFAAVVIANTVEYFLSRPLAQAARAVAAPAAALLEERRPRRGWTVEQCLVLRRPK